MKMDDFEEAGGERPTVQSVPLEKVIDGLEMQMDSVKAYLNPTTGDLVLVSDEMASAAEDGDDECPLTGDPLDDVRAALEGKDYLQLPDQYEINEYAMMECFAESMSDDKVSDELSRVIQGSGAFHRFKDTVWHLNLTEKWYEFRGKAYEKIAIDWCKENGIEFHR